jgi:signal peptidase I
MCASVDLKPINKRLVQDVSTRAQRAVHPQVKRAILFLMVMFTAIASYLLVSRFVVTAVVIKGRSMTPTLNDGDRFMLNRWVYHFRDPRPGDLVVIRDPGHDDFAVKRIIAIPSDTLLFDEQTVYVNGGKLSEPYLAAGTRTTAPEGTEARIQLPKDYYYVLGDNRSNSEDSRYYGPVHRSRIIGAIATSK